MLVFKSFSVNDDHYPSSSHHHHHNWKQQWILDRAGREKVSRLFRTIRCMLTNSIVTHKTAVFTAPTTLPRVFRVTAGNSTHRRALPHSKRKTEGFHDIGNYPAQVMIGILLITDPSLARNARSEGFHGNTNPFRFSNGGDSHKIRMGWRDGPSCLSPNDCMFF